MSTTDEHFDQTRTVASEPAAQAAPAPRRRRPGVRKSTLFSFVAALAGISALAAAGWVYGQTQRELARIGTELAEIRLSLELFNQREPQDGAAAGSEALDDVSSRLAILEQSWRGSLYAPGDTIDAAAPAAGFTPGPAAATATPVAPASGDCLPTGTRFMVAAGDVYPVCGTTAQVQIGGVDNGFITLADGTVIAQGGTVGLPASACMIAVLPTDGGSLSGFAEIRVTC